MKRLLTFGVVLVGLSGMFGCGSSMPPEASMPLHPVLTQRVNGELYQSVLQTRGITRVEVSCWRSRGSSVGRVTVDYWGRFGQVSLKQDLECTALGPTIVVREQTNPNFPRYEVLTSKNYGAQLFDAVMKPVLDDSQEKNAL